MVPINREVFALKWDHAKKVDLCKSHWNPQRKMGVAINIQKSKHIHKDLKTTLQMVTKNTFEMFLATKIVATGLIYDSPPLLQLKQSKGLLLTTRN